MNRDDSTGRRLTAEQVASLIAVTEPWLSCDGCFDALDLCVDALVDGADQFDAPLLVHFARCPACREEAGTLLTLAAQDRGMAADRLLERLDSLIEQVQTEPGISVPGRRRWTRRWRRR